MRCAHSSVVLTALAGLALIATVESVAAFWPSTVTIANVATATAYRITGTVVMAKDDQPRDGLVVIATLHYGDDPRSIETRETGRTENGIHFATNRFEILKMYADAEPGQTAIVTLLNKARPESEITNIKVERFRVRR